MNTIYQDVVLPWKEKKTAETYATLQKLSPAFAHYNGQFPKSWEFPLLKYILYLCINSVKEKDVATIQQTLQLWEQLLDHKYENSRFTYRDSAWLLVDKQYCNILPREANRELTLFTKEAIDQGFQAVPKTYLEQSWDLIVRTQFLPLVEQAGSIIVHLEHRANDNHITAYTTQFQGIIYTDWSDNPVAYAESVVHEAAHSLLNYYLEALEIKMPDNSYWSPWRRCERPAFGVLHGAWAFSHVYHFYHRLAELENNETYKRRAEQEKQQLLSVHKSLRNILNDIGSPKLEQLMQQIYPSPL